jgi:DNA uptake protein ComE-like DNA-binding protein
MLESKIHSDRLSLAEPHSVRRWQLPTTALLLTLVMLGGCKGDPNPSKYPPEKSSETAPAAKPAATSKIDINSASIAELDKLELPGTKPSLSERIQGKRPYKTADDLVGKKAISADEYKLIKDLIVVGKAK